MHALILAAGFGTRLKPFTDKHPKALVPVNGKPLILYILEFLKKNGIKDITINLYHHGDQIRKFLGTGKKMGLKISYSHERKILGTGGGIKKVMEKIKKDVLIINGDVIADFDLKKMLALHKKSSALATIGVYQHPRAKDYGLLRYQGTKLVSILGNPKPPAKNRAAMFGSYHILSWKHVRPLFKKFKHDEKFCIMRDIYIPQLVSGTKVNAYEMKGFWAVCDALKDVQLTEKNPDLPQLPGFANLPMHKPVL